MANGLAKVQLLIELKDKIKSGLSKARESVSSNVRQMKDKINEISTSTKGTFGKIRQTIKNQMNGAKKDFDKSIAGIKIQFVLLKHKAADALNNLRSHIPGGGLFDNFSAGAGLATASVLALSAAVIGIGLHMANVSKEIEQSQQNIKTAFGIGGKELDTVNAKVISTAKVFEVESKELTTSGNALFQTFKEQGLSAADSIGLVQQGLLATNGAIDLDNIREYAVQMKAAGLNADQTMAIISQQIKNGTFSDKGIDTIKEGGLRIREMTQATKDALKGIGLSGDTILKDLNSGAKNSFQVIQDVAAKMKGAGVQAQQTAIADIFGGPGEDLGLQGILAFADMKLAMADLIDQQDPFIQKQMQRLDLENKIVLEQQKAAPVFNELRGKLELIGIKARLAFYTIIARAVTWLQENMPTIVFVLKSIAIGLGIMGTLWAISNIGAIAYALSVGGVAIATGIATAAQWLWNAAVNASPLIVFTLIGGLILWLSEKTEGWGEMWTHVWEVIKSFVRFFGLYFTEMGEEIAYFIQVGYLKFKGFFEWLGDMFTNIGKSFRMALRGNFSGAWSQLTADINTESEKQLKVLEAKRNAKRQQNAHAAVEHLKSMSEHTKGAIGSIKMKKKEAQVQASDNNTDAFAPTGGDIIDNSLGGDSTATSDGKNKGGDAVNKVTGQAQQATSITVSIGSFVEGGINTSKTELNQMGAKEMEEWFTQMFLRVVRKGETIS